MNEPDDDGPEPLRFWPSAVGEGGHVFLGDNVDRWEGRRRTAQRLAEIQVEEGEPLTPDEILAMNDVLGRLL